MLEEALRSMAAPPAEVAQSLLSFVRFELQDGGANAEKRFITLFSLLCERLFGSMGGSKDGFRYQTGGWLTKQSPWVIPKHQPSQNSAHRPSVPSIDMDPVVQLLCGVESLMCKEKLPTFIEAISGNTEARRGARVQYPFYAMPKPTQDLFLKMVQSSVDGSHVDESMRNNAFRLFGILLHVAPRDQLELRRILSAQKNLKKDRSRPLSLSPGAQSQIFHATNGASKPADMHTSIENVKVMLTMTEYFLFSFIRYPLASPSPTVPAPQGHQRPYSGMMPRNVVPYGETVYLHLFRCYLLHYLPVTPQVKSFIGFPSLSVENEVFLRVIVEFWFCTGMEPTPLTKAAEAILERRKKTSGSSVCIDLESVFDLIQVKYDPQPQLVQKCVKCLITHTLRDPIVESAVINCSAIAGSRDINETVPLPWCLNPSMTVLQQDFYKYLVASFRHAPIHVVGSPFYAALDTWLLWLEPWNVETRRKQGPSDFAHAGSVLANTVTHMTHPTSQHRPLFETVRVLQAIKLTVKSKYIKEWEPFVAANLHLFTIPLALFLRRARELDFSAANFSRSYALVQRVFRVYSPELMNSIHSIQNEGAKHVMASLVEAHGTNLGAFSPRLVGRFEMSSLQTSMRNLLEEICMQHRKTINERGFFDRLEARVEGLFSYFGIVEASTGEERKIQQLIEKAKLIASLPPECQILQFEGGHSGHRTANQGSTNQRQHLRVNGILTEHGKAQVITGEIVCKPSDLVSITKDDFIYGPVKSHEMAWLVPLAIRASEYLNSRMSFGEPTTKAWLRFNLRWLADYRNLLFCFVALWLWVRLLH